MRGKNYRNSDNYLQKYRLSPKQKRKWQGKVKKNVFLFGKLRENIGIFASPQRYLRTQRILFLLRIGIIK